MARQRGRPSAGPMVNSDARKRPYELYHATNYKQTLGDITVKQVEAAVIGTGWCGGIRAETLSRSALVDKLHVCEIRPDRLKEVQALTRAAAATLDYQDIVSNPAIAVVYICTTPE